MTMDRTKKLAVAALVTGALTAGAILPAVAQGPTEDSAASEIREDRRAAHHAAFAEALAAELGLDTDQVSEAVATVREQLRTEHQAQRRTMMEERLAEAGDLTEAEADAILEAHEAGVMPFGGHGGNRGHGGMGGMGGMGMGGMGMGGAARMPSTDGTT